MSTEIFNYRLLIVGIFVKKMVLSDKLLYTKGGNLDNRSNLTLLILTNAHFCRIMQPFHP